MGILGRLKRGASYCLKIFSNWIRFSNISLWQSLVFSLESSLMKLKCLSFLFLCFLGTLCISLCTLACPFLEVDNIFCLLIIRYTHTHTHVAVVFPSV